MRALLRALPIAGLRHARRLARRTSVPSLSRMSRDRPVVHAAVHAARSTVSGSCRSRHRSGFRRLGGLGGASARTQLDSDGHAQHLTTPDSASTTRSSRARSSAARRSSWARRSRRYAIGRALEQTVRGQPRRDLVQAQLMAEVLTIGLKQATRRRGPKAPASRSRRATRRWRSRRPPCFSGTSAGRSACRPMRSRPTSPRRASR